MKKKFVMKTFAIDVAISFFFTAIFIILCYVAFGSKINSYSTIINTTVIKSAEEEKEVVYNRDAKRIVKYPEYGKKYATIKIPAIDLSLPVYNGDTLDILRYGVGTYIGSYLPGEGGTTLMAAHNDRGFFHDLDKLQPGDKIIIEANYGTFTYTVSNHIIVKYSETEAFIMQDGKERLILYTCYPIEGGIIGHKTDRYVVYAYREGDKD